MIDVPPLLIRRQRFDVGILPCGENGTNRRNDLHRKSASTENDMNECAPHSTISVGKWMDRLKLGMNDRCLSNRRNIRSRGEFDEVVHKKGDVVWLRWDVHGVERAMVRWAYPVLLGSKFSPKGLEIGASRKRHVNLSDDIGCQWSVDRELNRIFHGTDAVSDLSCHGLCGGRILSGLGDRAMTSPQAFDATRTDGFRAQEWRSHHLIVTSVDGRVELLYCSCCIFNEGRRLAR